VRYLDTGTKEGVMKQCNIISGKKLVVLALLIALLATVVLSTSIISADDSEVIFPDPNLEQVIREEIQKPAPEPVYASDLQGLTFLNASGRGIDDLHGLEYCTALTRLDLYDNSISDIRPLASLTSLRDLYLQNNLIRDISPLANLTNLRKLYLGSNRIDDLSPLTNLTRLVDLYLYGNQISNITPLSNLTELTDLHLSNNQVGDISSLGSLTKLTTLSLYNNQVSDIAPLANLTSLKRLSLRNNEISEISALSALTELRVLYLDKNQIVDINPLASLNKLGEVGEYVGWLESREGESICLGLQNNQIDDIAPIVSNEGLSEGDGIDLRVNPLSCESYGILLPQLEGRGVVVLYDAKTFPSQPTNTSPIDEATDISLPPHLESSAFSDPEGDAHVASQWQIRTSTGSYDSPVFDSDNDTTNKTQITIPSGKLTYSTTYYWRVRYQDSQMKWSCWSAETSFTTIPNQPPIRPTNTSPEDGATDVSLTPLLQSSAFFDPEEHAHAASQWQIRSASGDYSSPVFDSQEDTANLTQISIPSGKLEYFTGYYWRVRYQDSYGSWSEWSAETSFITVANQPPSQPTNTSPVDEAADVSLTPTLESSAFLDPNAGDAHTASQWQITTILGDYSSPVFDSGEDVHNLTSITIPSEILTYSTTYYWRVRYQDNGGAWSDWSSETSFVTEAEKEEAAGLPFWVWIVIALVGVILLAAGAILGDRLARRWRG
jgi:Leucine-rich repeat (LRR) protein